MINLTVDSNTEQICGNGVYTIVNNDLFNTLTVSPTVDFLASMSVPVTPLSAVTVVGPLYGKANVPISVGVVPQGGSYSPGSIISKNTTVLFQTNLAATTTASNTVTYKLFTPPRSLTLYSVYGTVNGTGYSGSSGDALDFTFETKSGFVIQSGSLGSLSAGADFSFGFQYASLNDLITEDDDISLVLSSTGSFYITESPINIVYQ